ncbi:GpE family phage tail protein [Pseudothauera hydrothermalis]|nr:GpE family phage tail protein [Pseudothauera hydrothermalis]
MDGLELLALAYHWPPEVGRAMDVAEFAEWVRRAQAALKARGGL